MIIYFAMATLRARLNMYQVLSRVQVNLNSFQVHPNPLEIPKQVRNDYLL